MNSKNELFRVVSPTGRTIIGMFEHLDCVAQVFGFYQQNGELEPAYWGVTELDWDSQESVEEDSRVLVVDEDGDIWQLEGCTIEGPIGYHPLYEDRLNLRHAVDQLKRAVASVQWHAMGLSATLESHPPCAQFHKPTAHPNHPHQGILADPITAENAWGNPNLCLCTARLEYKYALEQIKGMGEIALRLLDRSES